MTRKAVTPAAPVADALEVTMRPEPRPEPHVHVELRAAGRPTQSLHLATGVPTDLTALVVTDSKGAIASTVGVDRGGVSVTLARTPQGPWRVAYDIRATADARATTSAVVVAEDRYRAFGERLVLLPATYEGGRTTVTLTIDGEAIRAPSAASSFGVGTTRTREVTARALVHAAYLAGSLGSASLTEALDVDHAAWSGYTAFDPRPAVAEVAQIRTALRETWKGGGEEEHALLFVATARPLGSYALVPRASSLVVHLGPSEPWSPALRVAITQHLMHAWIGGELRMEDTDATWFHEGFARYLGARLLERLGFLKPADAQDYTAGLLEAQVSSLPRTRALARGALLAQRLGARIRERSKGQESLESAVILPLLVAARDAHAALSPAALEAALLKVLPDAGKDFATFRAGADLALPPRALGPCFRVRDGDYRTFDLGFDLAATLESPTRSVVGVVPGSPAAAAGLANGDVLEDASFRSGHPEVPVQVVVLRDLQLVTLTFPAGGARKKGQLVDRLANVPDAACGPVL